MSFWSELLEPSWRRSMLLQILPAPPPPLLLPCMPRFYIRPSILILNTLAIRPVAVLSKKHPPTISSPPPSPSPLPPQGPYPDSKPSTSPSQKHLPCPAMAIPEVELQNASLQAAGRSGSNPWQLFLYFIFPLPLVFLVLISLPFPARYRAKIRVGILVRFCFCVYVCV